VYGYAGDVAGPAGSTGSAGSTEGDEGDDGERVPIWARERRRRPSALSRTAIVEAALEIADTEGVDVVSIRRVAAALGARTMSLYTYIDSKDDLLDLMTDQVAGELIIEGELPGDWRAAITMIAQREREAGLRHPWLVELAHHRSHAVIGPNLLRHLDQSIAAVSGLKLGIEDTLRVVSAVDDYMLGFTSREARDREITRRTGLTGAEHLSAIRPYLQQQVDDGEFANIAPLLRGDVVAADHDFNRGLGWLLDGIEREYS
jgi:AcrR family transcriptional regulator